MSEPQSTERSDHPEPQPLAERQRQVEALADEYLERLIAGETPDRPAFLAAHPELADLLEPRLALVELMHRMARPAPAERALRMKCPHCGNGIQLIEPADGEVTCGSCGSSFHVDPRATATYNRAALPRTIGKFEVLEQLGRGAFGTVYKARDPELQRLVAIKVPRTGSFATSEEEERFLREARAAAQLSHPGIVPVLEIAHERGLPYIVSEYVEGLTLADVLTARRPAFREAAELIAAIADALDYAHRRHIVHRDIKPSNLLLDAAGRPHITDFGLARRGENEITVTLDGQIVGTPAYMAPEQAAGDQQRVDARSDVYSLGVVLYELLTGELPFRGNQRMLLHQVLHDEPRPPRSLNDRLPRDLETICLKAMAKLPARRYASALEMADDLRRFLNNEPIRARPVGRPEKLSRWARRNPVVAALTVAVAVLLVAVAVGEFIFVVTERRLNRDLSDAKETAERNQREAEVRAASAAVDLDLKHCEDGEIEYGVLRLARTLGSLPSHAMELRQCVEMNLLAWAQAIRPLGPTFQYDGAETKWELSPDGLTVLTGGADGTARLWDAFSGEVRATLRGHCGAIASVAFSKNGRVAMTVCEDRTVRLWDVSNGQARGATAEHPKKIDKALLSPDGRRLLTIHHEELTSLRWPPNPDDKSVVTVFDTVGGNRVSDLIGHSGRVYDAAFSPDGQTLLTGGADKTARFWSADNGAPLGTLQGHTGAVIGVAFSPEVNVAATLDTVTVAHPQYSEGHPVHRVRWWDLRQFLQIGPPCLSDSGDEHFRFIHRDVAIADTQSQGGGWWPTVLFIRGREQGIDFSMFSSNNCRADDDSLFDSEGRHYDRTGKLLAVSPGRKFNRELARFAAGGKYIVLQQGLIDLATEKAIGKRRDYDSDRDSRYVSSRQSFVALQWSGPEFMRISFQWPLPSTPLDTEVAQLFAEVITCHELDPAGTTQLLKETEWEERRQKLIARLDEHPASSLISRLAADRWFWLRRQADRAKAKNSREEEIKYLDRLIAVEPSWQNYDRRARTQYELKRQVEAARDVREAGLRAGKGYWKGDWRWSPNGGFQDLASSLILPDMRPLEEYQMGLRLVKAISNALPEDRGSRVLVPIALYRLGRYAEALSDLEGLLKERERNIVCQVGQFFMMGWPAVALSNWRLLGRDDIMKAMAFLAMTHHHLGHRDRARAAFDDLRRLGDVEFRFALGGTIIGRYVDGYQKLLREAETLIEGQPRPGK